MPGGRPTTYTPQVIKKAWEYADGGWQNADHAIPSIVGLCSVINRSTSTVYSWAADDDKEFLDILQKIKQEQELITFNKSLTGEYNATIAKLLLGKHGYHDKQDNTHAGADGSAIRIEEVRRTIVDPGHTDS